MYFKRVVITYIPIGVEQIKCKLYLCGFIEAWLYFVARSIPGYHVEWGVFDPQDGVPCMWQNDHRPSLVGEIVIY